MIILATPNRAAVVSIANDELPSAFLNRLKRAAKKAVPRFRPFKLSNETEWFIVHVDSREFEQFKSDPDIAKANVSRTALADGLTAEGDLLWNGMIIRACECTFAVE